MGGLNPAAIPATPRQTPAGHCGCDLYGFYTGTMDAEDEPKRLTDKHISCTHVILSLSSTEDDPADTLKAGAASAWLDTTEAVYWGFSMGGQLVGHQLFPAETTQLIPVRSTGDILIRRNVNKGVISRVTFSCFKKNHVPTCHKFDEGD